MRPLIALLLSLATGHAAGRTSADYAVPTETLDFGGASAASADYAQAGSVAAVGGSSGAATPVPTIARHGYLGQLYDLLGYALLASDYYPAELGTTQLFPVRTADDGTNLVIPTAGFSFSVVSGPLASISPAGVVTAGTVYDNTAAVAGATSPAFAGQITLPLFVQDTLPDNFGSYAGDGIADGWQVQYFGLDNPLAAPALDPDADGQSNLFEYTAGLVPTDAASIFRLRIEAVPNEPHQKRLVFSPVLPGRTYTAQAKSSLLDPTWLPLDSATSDSLLPERTVTDLSATGAQKFYRIEITGP